MQNIERTLIIAKPDAMERNLAGEIISRFQKAGLRVAGLKMMQINRELAEQHYSSDDSQVVGMGNKTLQATGEEKVLQIFGTIEPKEVGMKLREWLLSFIISKPVIVFVLEGENAIAEARKITGSTDPSKSEKGTVRGDLGDDSIAKANEEGRPVVNLVHASD